MKQKQLIIKKQAVKRKNNWNFFPRNACKLNKSHYLCTRNQEITDLQIRIDSLAQQVEHNTFNVGVLGSSPRRITRRKAKRRQQKDKSYKINILWDFFYCLLATLTVTKRSLTDKNQCLIRTPDKNLKKGVRIG